MSISDRILAQLKKGPATCWQISQATGILSVRVSTSMNQLLQRLEVKPIGHCRNEHGNLVPVWDLRESSPTLLDEYWTRPATVEYREGANG